MLPKSPSKASANPGAVQALLRICRLIASAQAGLFAWLEGWRLADAFRFSVVSKTTVDLGDVTPQTGLGKLFSLGFLRIGIGMFALTVTSIAQVILRELCLCEGQDEGGPGSD